MSKFEVTASRIVSAIRAIEDKAPTAQQHLLFATIDAVRNVSSVGEQLAFKCDQLANRMSRVAGYVKESDCVNSLGEVQGMGADVDRLCGEYEKAKKSAVAFLHLCAKFNLITIDADASMIEWMA